MAWLRSVDEQFVIAFCSSRRLVLLLQKKQSYLQVGTCRSTNCLPSTISGADQPQCGGLSWQSFFFNVCIGVDWTTSRCSLLPNYMYWLWISFRKNIKQFASLLMSVWLRSKVGSGLSYRFENYSAYESIRSSINCRQKYLQRFKKGILDWNLSFAKLSGFDIWQTQRIYILTLQWIACLCCTRDHSTKHFVWCPLANCEMLL